MNKPTITIEEFDQKIIYIRFRGSYVEFRKHSRHILKELIAFGKANNLIDDQSRILTIYHDNPYITDGDNLRTSMAMTIPRDASFEESGEVNSMLVKGKYGVGHFEIAPKEYEEAWNHMYHQWLFKSDHKPRDSFPFELYVTKPSSNMSKTSLTDIYIPIE